MNEVFPGVSDAVMAPSGRIGASGPAPLVDRFGRVHTDLRLSVTDRCTLRCTYCMPLDARFKPRDELLSFDEFERVVTVAARLGIRSIRVTGGEPLLRPRLPDLIARLVAVPGIEEVALTTNGLLLSEQAESLHGAGLHRVNVSLDALDDEAFRRIARADGLDRVLAGLAAAGRAGFRRIRVNAVSIRGLTEAQVVPLARFCRGAGFQLRFIEFMPLDAESGWSSAQVLTGAEVRSILEREFGPLEALPSADPGQPAVDWRWSDGASVGFIDPVSKKDVVLVLIAWPNGTGSTTSARMTRARSSRGPVAGRPSPAQQRHAGRIAALGPLPNTTPQTSPLPPEGQS